MVRRLPRAEVAALYDGAVRNSLIVEPDGEGLSISRLSHQDCSAILDANKAALAEGGSRTLSFGKCELSIPVLELQKLKRRYPDLDSPDRQTKVRAWKRYIRSSESKPWRVSVPKYGVR